MSPAVKRRERAALASGAFSAELTTVIPLLPKGLLDPQAHKAQWTADDLKTAFCLGRSLLDGAKANDLVGAVHHSRLCYFSDGLRLTGKASNDTKLLEWMAGEKVWPMLRRLSNDVWREWLLQDNAVAFWKTPAEGELPSVVVLDCEVCNYSSRMGEEVLKVKLKQVTLTPEEKAEMQSKWGPRWVDAYTKGKEITLDPKEGENFKVLTWQKLGHGFGMPRLKAVLDLLSTRQLLQTADWAGAWESVNLTELWSVGHEIKTGPLAGKPTHFITEKKQTAMEKSLKNKRGGRRVVTNFDVSLAYKYLEAAFFDPKKYAGVMAALKLWGGAPVAMFESGIISPLYMQNFQAEGMKSREMVSDFIFAIVNDESFFVGKDRPETPITLGWNPHSFLETKAKLEVLRLAGANAWASPQTAREALGFDDQVEGDRLVEAHKTPERYRPPFEAKQGMGGSTVGGRPAGAKTGEGDGK